MKKRYKFRCWHCNKVYSQERDIAETEGKEIVVTCPFCKEKAVVDISFSPKKTETVLYRGVEKSAKENEPLPDILLTRKP